jgi:hypothetical protein
VLYSVETAIKFWLPRHRVGVAKAEEQARLLQAQLDHEIARADRLEALLARPWWRRLIG